MPNRPRSRIANHLRVIRASLKRIDRTVRQLEPLARKVGSLTPGPKLRLSPARRRQLKLQGSYVGFMRQLTPKQKDRVRAVKAKRGLPAAIAVARRMASRS